jgi:hypothetical protein
MNSNVVWSDQVPDRDGLKNPINDVAFSPGMFYALQPVCNNGFLMQFFVDGTRVIIAVGNRVLLYNAETGDLLESLRGPHFLSFCRFFVLNLCDRPQRYCLLRPLQFRWNKICLWWGR